MQEDNLASQREYETIPEPAKNERLQKVKEIIRNIQEVLKKEKELQEDSGSNNALAKLSRAARKPLTSAIARSDSAVVQDQISSLGHRLEIATRLEEANPSPDIQPPRDQDFLVTASLDTDPSANNIEFSLHTETPEREMINCIIDNGTYTLNIEYPDESGEKISEFYRITGAPFKKMTTEEYEIISYLLDKYIASQP